MSHQQISEGTVHKLPKDFKEILASDKKLLAKWESLTPLARNEWICWIEFVKKPETRTKHIIRAQEELIEGMKRPCCWIGCIHRTDKEISPSVKYVLSKRKSKQT